METLRKSSRQIARQGAPRVSGALSSCALLAHLALLAACGAPGTAGGSSRGEPGPGGPGVGGPGAGQAVAIDEQELRPQLQAWWGAFLRAAPSWPEHREAWLAGNEREQNLLFELLLFELVRGNQPVEEGIKTIPAWKRGQREFAYFGSAAIRPLINSIHVMVERVDWVAVDRVGETLADLASVDEVLVLLDDPDAQVEGKNDLRFAVSRVLFSMRDPAATVELDRLLRTDSDWRVRAKSADGLARVASRLELGEQSVLARDGLVQALVDEDPYVRDRACLGLSRVRVPSVREALVDRLERAIRDGDQRLLASLQDALEQNTNRRGVPRDAGAWRRVLEAEDG